jgi:hypothetical protein
MIERIWATTSSYARFFSTALIAFSISPISLAFPDFPVAGATLSPVCETTCPESLYHSQSSILGILLLSGKLPDNMLVLD